LSKYTIATRGSKLALIQTEIVTNSLHKLYPTLECEVVKIKSSGDINKNKFLFSVDEKAPHAEGVKDGSQG
jgi:porphobilinogen deaminase